MAPKFIVVMELSLKCFNGSLDIGRIIVHWRFLGGLGQLSETGKPLLLTLGYTVKCKSLILVV